MSIDLMAPGSLAYGARTMPARHSAQLEETTAVGGQNLVMRSSSCPASDSQV